MRCHDNVESDTPRSNTESRTDITIRARTVYTTNVTSTLRSVYMCQNIDAVSNHDLLFLINICHKLYYIHTVSGKNICIVLCICKRGCSLIAYYYVW